MSKALIRYFTALLFLVALAGCSSKGHHSKNLFDAFLGPDSYERMFDNHTDEKRVYSEFEPVMTAFVTNWDEDMREAYVDELSREFRYEPEKEKQIAKEQLAEEESFFTFIVTVATREPQWADFDKSTSMWRLTLENQDGSVQVTPERIEAVSQKDEVAKYFYKRMDSFTRTFKVRFPKKEPLKSAKTVYFHISGPRGSLTFEEENEQPKAVHE